MQQFLESQPDCAKVGLAGLVDEPVLHDAARDLDDGVLVITHRNDSVCQVLELVGEEVVEKVLTRSGGPAAGGLKDIERLHSAAPTAVEHRYGVGTTQMVEPG